MRPDCATTDDSPAAGGAAARAPGRPASTTASADGADTGVRLPDRGTVGLLLDPVFGPYFAGKLLSTGGVWVFNIVAAVLVWDLTHSALAVGAVSVALFIPQLLFAPLSGARADRDDPKAQLLVGRGLVTVASGGLAVATAAMGTSGLPGAWVVIAAAALVGVGFVVGGPAQHSLLPSLARPAELSRAVALNALPPTLARAGGPVLGTLLLVSAGPAWAFAVTALTNLLFGVVVALLPLADRVERAPEGEHTVRAGLAYLRRERTVALLLVGMLAVGLGADPVITLTPPLSAAFGQGETLVGAFATSFGIGAALALLAVSAVRLRVGGRGLTALGLGALAVGLLVTGLAPVVPVAITGLALGGVGFCWALTGATTRVYERVPESLRGRVMALWSMAFIGSRPVGAAVSGAVADATSVRLAFVVVAAIVAALGLWSHVGAARGDDGAP